MSEPGSGDTPSAPDAPPPAVIPVAAEPVAAEPVAAEQGAPALAPPPLAPLPPPVPVRPARARVWTVFVVSLLAIVGSQVGAALGIGVYIVVLAARGDLDLGAGDLSGRITGLIMTPAGLLFALVPAEVVLVCAAVIPARLSKEPWRERLGLVRGTLPAWGLLLLLPAQVFVVGVVQLLFTLLFDEVGQHLTDLSEGLTGATGLLGTLLLLGMSVLPGFAEELLDRGYLQRRLVRRWGPVAGIAIASLIFGLAHLDPQHAVATAFLGVWFGVIAWRTGAVWPSMVCHGFSNFFGIGLAMLGAQHAEDHPIAADASATSTALSGEQLLYLALMLAVSAPFFIGSIILLRRLK